MTGLYPPDKSRSLAIRRLAANLGKCGKLAAQNNRLRQVGEGTEREPDDAAAETTAIGIGPLRPAGSAELDGVPKATE